MRTLVTGGAGFIGSTLVRHLLADESVESVTCYDALTYAGHRINLTDVESDPRFSFVHGDICDREAISEALGDVDVVYHLAAETHVDRSIVEDAPFLATNVVGTAVLLSAAADRGLRFVHVSTDEVYGELPWADPDDSDPSRERFTELSPIAPRSPYAASKAASDHLVAAYHETHELDAVITRCSNNYGPRQFPEKLIPVAIDAALAGDPIPLYGDGLHVRDWISVEDHCRGLIAAADRGRSGEVYNFGGDAERTNRSVAAGVLHVLDLAVDRIESVPDRPGHDRRYAIDFTKARQELGWSPTATFELELEQTVRWYVENRAWVDAVRSDQP